MTSIRLERLTRRFAGNERAAVRDLDLEVASGEVLSLVGPSGCGKSTTLRLVAGLDFPDAGDIRIGERSVRALSPQERDVAMVFQGFALYPHMRVREILAFPLRMRKAARAEIERRIDEVAALLGITALLDRRPGELSGGEQQRVAMGRVIVRRPQVFLFDEPLSNLDAALRHELRLELGKLLRRLGTTALYVTHDQVEAMTLSDRIAVMRAGQLEQVGTPRDIYERPATAFVASFFGTPAMNLVLAERSGSVLTAGPLHLPAPDFATSDRLTVGFRPEAVELLTGAPGPDSPGAELNVTAVEPLGAETHVELALGPTTLRARAPGFSRFAPGDLVRVRVSGDALHYFDAESGRALATARGTAPAAAGAQGTAP
jgi:multiple sugar transport system ATP-binding protein